MRKIFYLTLSILGLYASAFLLAKGLAASGIFNHMTIGETQFTYGFFGAGLVGGLVSWIMSNAIADWSVNARPYGDEQTDATGQAGDLRPVIARLAPSFGLKKAVELRVYDSPDVNAFPTGNRLRSKVYVTTGLLERLPQVSAEAVVAHQLAKIAAGDVPTLLLMHGIVNVFTVFPTRMFSLLIGTSLRTAEEETPADGIENGMRDLFELLLVPFTGLVTRQFARAMERRADALAARVVGRDTLVALLSHFEAASPPATREMFTAPLTFTAKVRRALRFVSYHNPMPVRTRSLIGKA